MAKLKSQGTTLEIEQPAATWVAVGQITGVNVGGGAAPDIDVTDLDSTEREFLAGLAGGEEITINVWWDRSDSGQALVEARKGQNNNFRVTLVDASVGTFAATIRDYSSLPTLGVDAALTGSITLRKSGAVTWT